MILRNDGNQAYQVSPYAVTEKAMIGLEPIGGITLHPGQNTKFTFRMLGNDKIIKMRLMVLVDERMADWKPFDFKYIGKGPYVIKP